MEEGWGLMLQWLWSLAQLEYFIIDHRYVTHVLVVILQQCVIYFASVVFVCAAEKNWCRWLDQEDDDEGQTTHWLWRQTTGKGNVFISIYGVFIPLVVFVFAGIITTPAASIGIN